MCYYTIRSYLTPKVTSTNPTPDTTMTLTLVNTFDSLALFISRCIGVAALTLVVYAGIQLVKINQPKESPAPAPKAEEIDFQYKPNQLTQRGDPGWPPLKEKSRMA